MDTQFAPSERSSIEIILNDYELFQDSVTQYEFIDNILVPTLILNEERQIIYTNKTLLAMLKVREVSEILGKRPGEVLGCVNSDIEEGGCGTSMACTVCGAVNTILQAQMSKEIKKGQCLVSVAADKGTNSGEFEVTVSPIEVNGRYFYVFSLMDISEEKRRQALEKIFFHDLLNTAGGLTGVVNLMKDHSLGDQCDHLVEMIERISKNLVEEVQAQKELLAAEKGELKLYTEFFSSKQIMEDVIVGLQNHTVAENKTLIIAEDSVDTTLESDPRLLKRIIMNMTKNALEAEEDGSVVKLSCNFTGEDKVSFNVQNPKVIPEKIQLQIFQRSFSTKGAGRGLGTYSIKLLSEKYLNGFASFVSTKGTGTIFTSTIPVVVE